ncbi:hypothetical protein ACJIZ3_017850 [Penstemon smallii]|uniref:Uncharacterized protein n=1 Tax=Penstemon smallii TaxID=265156 RepID=A0ABD3SXW3_9LAMI
MFEMNDLSVFRSSFSDFYLFNTRFWNLN